MLQRTAPVAPFENALRWSGRLFEAESELLATQVRQVVLSFGLASPSRLDEPQELEWLRAPISEDPAFEQPRHTCLRGRGRRIDMSDLGLVASTRIAFASAMDRHDDLAVGMGGLPPTGLRA